MPKPERDLPASFVTVMNKAVIHHTEGFPIAGWDDMPMLAAALRHAARLGFIRIEDKTVGDRTVPHAFVTDKGIAAQSQIFLRQMFERDT